MMDAMRLAAAIVIWTLFAGWLLSVLYRMTLTQDEAERELMGETIQPRTFGSVFLHDVQALHSWILHNGLLAFLAMFLGTALLLWLLFA